MREGSWLTAALALLSLGQPASAVAPEEIVVTAGRTGDPLEAFGGEVVARQEIELLQPVSTLDLLDRVAGVRAFEKGGVAGASYVGIRGGEPNFTLVLLDGIRVNDPMNSRGGAFDFAQIDPLALERIEIAKGALSAVHGADALSGVINLRLRDVASGERLIAGRIFGDTRGGVGASAVAGTGWSGGNVLAGASWYDSGDLTEASELSRWQIFGRAAQEVGPVELTALALHARTERSLFPEDSGGPRLAVIREREQRDTQLTVAGLSLSKAEEERWRPRLSLAWVRQDEEADTPPIAPGPVIDGVPAITADSRFERVEATLENRIELGPAAEIAFGGSWIREEGAATGTIDFGFLIPADFAIERESVGAFAEATVRPAPWLLATAGARYDNASSRGPEWTGRAGVRIEPLADAPAIFASWSEGYKLPSLFALAYPIIANPELKPERSDSYEVGLEDLWADGRGRVRLSYFYSRYRDLIDFDPEAFINVNRSRVVAQGFEAQAAVPLSPTLGLSGTLTYMDTDQPKDAAPLRSRPEWQGLVAVDWRPNRRTDVYVSGAYTGEFFDSSVPTGLVTLDPRLVVTAAFSYRLSPNLSATVTARNIFADEHEDAIGFPSPQRVVRASIEIRN